jgi:dihydroorotate dehydrogenase
MRARILGVAGPGRGVKPTWYERLLRPILFRIDPETAHNAAISLIAKGLIRGQLVRDPRLAMDFLGKQIPHPFGLAAGVDKQATVLWRWREMGFSFAEIGTITSLGQPGNPRPRLFRFPDQKAVINRMGFNNVGSEVAHTRLRDAAKNRRNDFALGINLGKSKVTEPEHAAADYALSYSRLAAFADYAVINVSSPNTPGLRNLQAVKSLREIVDAVRQSDAPQIPLFVKIAPDLAWADIDEICEYAVETHLTGLIATNTALDRTVLKQGQYPEGGISGAPILSRSNDVLRHVRGRVGPAMTLIGVGGIFDGRDLAAKLEAGANVAQTYTGWIYGGPKMPARTCLELLDILRERQLNSVRELQPWSKT